MIMHKQFKPRHVYLLAALSAAYPVVSYGAAAGRVDFSVGNVVANGADGTRRVLTKGADIFSGDTVLTNDGQTQFRFSDGSVVSLQPGSEYRIVDYRFNGAADGTEKGFFSLLKGGLRTITGLVGRSSRDNYRVTTNVATIGIRGTEYSVTYGNSINVNVGEGEVEVCNSAGCVILQPGDEGYVKDEDWSPKLVQNGNEKVGKEDLFQSFDSPSEQRTDSGASSALQTDATQALVGTQTYATAWVTDYPETGVSSGIGTIAANGTLTDFETGSGTTGANIAGGNSVQSFGNDGVVAWGRWIDNGSGFTGYLSGGEGAVVHYVTGVPTADSQPALASMYGTSATFSLLGGGVTGSSTGAGSVTSGSMNVNFTVPEVTALAIGMTLGSSSYSLTASNLSISGFGSAPVFSGSGSATGSGCSSGCSASLNGAFFGAGAARAGVAFQFYDGQSIAGAAAFKNNATP
jgi:hypothetical protein